jgi:hypothetical protein
MRRIGSLALVLAVAWGGLAVAGDFTADAVGFLERHCIDCHAGPDAEMGFRLDDLRDEATVLAARPRWRKIQSRVAAGEMPPPDAERPPAAAQDAFLAAVSAACARADAAPPDPGPSVIRRLSRAEYDNTIRDLFQTDFRAGAAFPADGVGYGFTNIADVLTVSPLLMDRYLDAAAEVAARVLPVAAPKPVARRMPGMECDPKASGLPREPFRALRAGAAEPALSGPLTTPAATDAAGEYVVRARVFADSPDGGPVRVALMAAGRRMGERLPAAHLATISGHWSDAAEPRAILGVHEITARSAAEAQTIESPLVRKAGVARLMVGLLKPAAGSAAPTLHVEWLGYEGPRDPRSAATKAFLRADPSLPPAERDRENLGRLATRAWRRPVDAGTVAALVRMVDDAEAAGRSREDGLRAAIAAVLAAPEFVFRIEGPPPPESVGAVPVPDVELASRLSYFLWSSCPDEELHDLAVRGELAANLDAQVRRMLADPRSGALVDEFAMQWLGLGRLEVHGVDADQFPLWRRQLSVAMVEETRRFVGDVFRGDGSLLALLDADFTWVNHSLATLYELEPRPPLRKDEWRRVTFAPGLRSGLLTQAAILTVTSNPARTSPVKRGKWILETLLGDPPPMAPADVPSIEDTERRQLTGTFRQRMEQHRSDPRCAGCHRRMDAFGFALEEFNPIGQRRKQDEAGLPIDTSADIGGRRSAGLAGLKGYLLEHRAEFVRCLATKLLIYALGRGLEPGDEAALATIERAVAASDHRFSGLIHAIVHSVPFRMRRGAAQEFAAQESTARTTMGDTP